MSRKLKFRVWNKNTNKYEYTELDYYFVIDQRIKAYIYEQYTGLKDKNGKEIYEGDVVRQFDDEEYFVVKFEYGGFLPFTANMMTFDVDYCEVIGNIHENPELLGDKE